METKAARSYGTNGEDLDKRLEFAKNLYSEIMAKSTQAPIYRDPLELQGHHIKAVQSVLESSSTEASLTDLNMDDIKQMLESMFENYNCKNEKRKNQNGLAIGIDLGTTYCCVAVFRNNNAEIIPSEVGRNKIPSYVAFQTIDDDDNDSKVEIVCGETAKDSAYENQKGTIYDVKRMFGRNFQDPRLQRDMHFWPFDVIDDNGQVKIKTEPESSRSPVEIAAELLKFLKERASAFLAAEVFDVIVTVPAYFNAQQRKHTADACSLADLNVLQLVNEPTAAAVAFNFRRNANTNKTSNCLIFDFGGGTLDIAVLTIISNRIHVKAVGGDNHLGGQDIDNNLVEYCLEKFKDQHGVDLLGERHSADANLADKVLKRLRRLKAECERQKQFLSAQVREVTISLNAMYGTTDLVVPITRTEFDSMNMKLFETCVKVLDDVLKNAKMDRQEVDEVVMVGGSSRIPRMQEMISDYFGGKKPHTAVDVDEAVAVGASMLAFSGEHIEIPDVIFQEPGSCEYLQEIHLPTLQPLQIIHLNQDATENEPWIICLENALKSILSRTGGRPVAVIAITGPPRTGKSEFLNFVLRRLNGFKNDKLDMVSDNGTPQEFTLKQHNEDVLPGIWMWPEPFTLQSKKLEAELDVLVMETRGIFDDKFSVEKWTKLLGLSLLTSSCLIMNVVQEINQRKLKIMEQFLSFGLSIYEEKIVAGKRIMRAFQQLAFLVRDWKETQEYPYGAEGGDEFIEQNNAAYLTKLRKSFQDVSCFLLPSAGANVPDNEMSRSMQSSVNFAEKVEKVIDNLINPSNLASLSLFGNSFTGQDLLEQFKRCVDSFNDEEKVNIDTIELITSECCNTVIINKCLSSFTAAMNAKLGGSSYILQEDLKSYYIETEDNAMKLFENSSKFGSKKVTQKLKDKLRKMLKSKYDELKKQNYNGGSAAAVAHDKAISKYLKITKKIDSETTTAFLDDAELQSTLDVAEAEAMILFNSILSNTDSTSVLQEKEQLRASIQGKSTEFIISYKLKKREAEKEMKDTVHIYVQVYKTGISKEITGKLIVTDEELLAAHKTNSKKSIDDFTRKYSSSALYHIGKGNLLSMIQKEFHDFKDDITQKRDALEKFRTTVQRSVEWYREEMTTVTIIDEDEFFEAHALAKERAVEMVQKSEKIPAVNKTQVLIELETKLQYAQLELLMQVKQNKMEIEKTITDAIKTAKKKYNDTMQSFINKTKNAIMKAELKAHHNKEKMEATQKLKEFYNGMEGQVKNVKNLENTGLEELIASIQSLYADYKDTNNDRWAKRQREDMREECRNLVQQSLEKYWEEMTALTIIDEDEFQGAHVRARERAVEMVRQSEKLPALEMVQVLADLEIKLKYAQLELLMRVKQDKLEMDKAIADEINAAKKTYMDAMHSFINQTNNPVMKAELKARHNQEKIEATQKLKEFYEDMDGSGKKALELENSGLEKLNASIQSLYADYVNTNNDRWAKRLRENMLEECKTIVQGSVEKYREEMTAYTIIDEDDFQDAHVCVKERAMEIVRKSEKMSAVKKAQVLIELETKLQYVQLELLMRFKQDKMEIDKAMAYATKAAKKKYKEAMHSFINQTNNPVMEAELKARHTQEKIEATQKLKEFYDGMEGRVKKVKKNAGLEELDASIQSLYADYENTNNQKWTNFKTMADAWVSEAKTTFTAGVEKIPKDYFNKDDIKTKESKIREETVSFWIRNADRAVVKPELLKNVVDDLHKLTEAHFDESTEDFEAQREKDRVAVKAALFEPKKYYNKKMDKRFNSNDWLASDELPRINSVLIESSATAAKAEIPLEPFQEKYLREDMKAVLRKYTEENAQSSPKKCFVIGIDLGTTYSRVGVFINGDVKIIPDQTIDETVVPSYVAFLDNQTTVVGGHAKSHAFLDPLNTVFDAKRLIGRSFSDPAVINDIKLWPFKVVNEDGQPKIRVREQTFLPEQISAKVLLKMKQIAEKYLNQSVYQAVITVPAYFNDRQRQATRDAAEMAGLNVMLLSEPTAAAMAYKLHLTDDLRRNVLIFDMGQGAFDVAVLEIMAGEIKVKATGGDTNLGGEDFVQNMVSSIIDRVKRKHRIDLGRDRDSSDPYKKNLAGRRLRRLSDHCKRATEMLSTSRRYNIALDSIDDNFFLEETFTRNEFDQINMHHFKKCIMIVESVLKDAGLPKTKVDDIVLVGGSTRIPKVQELLREFFDGKKELSSRINPEEVVACGAAMYAALLNGKPDKRPKVGMKLFDSICRLR